MAWFSETNSKCINIMKRECIYIKTQLNNVPKSDGLSLEEEIHQMIEQGTPIDASSPMIYNECKDGVDPSTDIRTDKFKIALAATSKYAKSVTAKSKEVNKDVLFNKPTETKEDK